MSFPADGEQSAAIVSYRNAVARAAPSVVTVHSSHLVPGRLPLTGKALVKGLASGVILDRDGYIVTNYHVVEDASELAVALADGTLHQTRIVGADPESDIALLKIDADGLRPIVLADINEVAVGDVALAVGNPLGVGQTVTQGIISAIVRTGHEPNRKLHSDRRGDQSRQLGRRADRHRRASGGHQHRDSLAQRRIRRHWASPYRWTTFKPSL